MSAANNPSSSATVGKSPGEAPGFDKKRQDSSLLEVLLFFGKDRRREATVGIFKPLQGSPPGDHERSE
jgi:hypothetical protein